jgi:hypothetical protein
MASAAPEGGLCVNIDIAVSISPWPPIDWPQDEPG